MIYEEISTSRMYDNTTHIRHKGLANGKVTFSLKVSDVLALFAQ